MRVNQKKPLGLLVVAGLPAMAGQLSRLCGWRDEIGGLPFRAGPRARASLPDFGEGGARSAPGGGFLPSFRSVRCLHRDHPTRRPSGGTLPEVGEG